MTQNRSSQPTLPADVHAVILAGGSGTRFWPKSRHLRPKQLCRIGSSDATMLERTLARLDAIIPPERRLIVTHRDQATATRSIAGSACPKLLAEPEARNTANALALAALQITALHRMQGHSGYPIMVSVHADHVIRNEPAFQQAIHDAVAVARSGRLALLGIVPQYPETGYGYIERGAPLAESGIPAGVANVKSFREKPDLDTARRYVDSGDFYWNAGLFVWRTDVILAELRERLPASVQALEQALAGRADGFFSLDPAELAAIYSGLPKISIDHAVLELSRNVAVIPVDMGWQDVGSWDALDRCFGSDADGNLVYGDAKLIDTRGTTIDSDGPFVATIGLEDMVVVVADGAVLVCPKSRAQEVKKVVDWLGEQKRKELT